MGTGRLGGRFRKLAAALAASVMLASCGGGSDATLAELSGARAEAATAGLTPFIAVVPVRILHVERLSSVNFTIAAQPGAASRPVNVTYSMDWLSRHNYLGTDFVKVPVFGLYAGLSNAITITLKFSDQSETTLPAQDFTAAADTPDVYTAPSVTMARRQGSALGFDYFYVKSRLGPPVVLDTDGKVRWRASVPALKDSMASTFDDGGFDIGYGVQVFRIELDGTSAVTGSVGGGVKDFHHDLEVGQTGLLDNVDAIVNGGFELEGVAQEIALDGTILHTWDMVKIIRDYMTANGDDPDLFVRPNVDWFHMNTAYYDAADDSVLISSRENFVIKLDYASNEIRWIFGDPTKYWYTFPSLRAKALTLLSGIPPIGQHAVSIAPDGNMLLFNDGEGSLGQPPGAPPGETRTYSEVSSDAIDDSAMTATESWGFDYGQSVFSAFCSSAYQSQDGSVLVDYATPEHDTRAYLVGLNPAHQVVFDYRYPETGCDNAWNSQPIAFEALTLQ